MHPRSHLCGSPGCVTTYLLMLPLQHQDRLCSDLSPEIGRSGALRSLCAATETFTASSPSSGNRSRSKRLNLPPCDRLLHVSHATKACLRFSSADGTTMISAKDTDCKDHKDELLRPSASSQHHFWVTLRMRGWGSRLLLPLLWDAEPNSLLREIIPQAHLIQIRLLQYFGTQAAMMGLGTSQEVAVAPLPLDVLSSCCYRLLVQLTSCRSWGDRGKWWGVGAVR